MTAFFDQPIEFTAQEGSGAPVWTGRLPDGEALLAFTVAARENDARLAALWGSDERSIGAGFRLHVVFGFESGHLYLTLDLPANQPCFPDLAGIFPAANRMQRATRDMVGIATDGGDQRPWLRHGGWPADWYPLRHDAGPGQDWPNEPSDYAFLQVGGQGAHEIPVGPIHAGIIEPGHFRFSVIGERVLRLEQRLGYQHKGVEKRFIGRTLDVGAQLVGRISGDSTCAYAWAYADAVEAACGTEPTPRALGLRALILERERVANHLGDLGMLGNDAAFAFGLSQFSRLKEDWVRLSAEVFGHRFMMDRIVPGGLSRDVTREQLAALSDQCVWLAGEVAILKKLYDEHAGLQDRFLTTGPISPELARELSLSGMAARACGLMLDGRAWRQDYTPPAPYAGLGVRPATDERGDVAARVAVRFLEVFESLRLMQKIAGTLPGGPVRVEMAPKPGTSGLGVVEGWRGEVVVGVALDAQGRLARVHPHDPSWQAWPALEFAVLRDIVPDFPLINKSFNLSYSGADL